MGKIYSQIDMVRKIFYNQDFKFTGFRDVNDEKLEEIDKLIRDYRHKYLDTKKSYATINNNTQEYTKLLEYLIKRVDLSWDDKMLFVIRFYDPELKMLQLYLETEQIDPKVIEQEDNSYVKEELKEYKRVTEMELQATFRSLFKIYDPNIIKYEKKLFRILQAKKLKFGIKKDYLKLFFESYATPDINLSISDTELTNIIEAACEYKKRYGIPTINDLAFQLTQQPKEIGIRSARKAIIFMIYVLDEHFKSFHIYDEIGNWNKIRNISFSELGFFNKDFVLSEIKFDRDNHNSTTTLSLFPDSRINH